jgi:hypothetical protein
MRDLREQHIDLGAGYVREVAKTAHLVFPYPIRPAAARGDEG